MDLKDKILNILWGRDLNDADAIAVSIVEAAEEHFMDSVAWYTEELRWYVDKAAELEVDVLIEKNGMVKFPVPGKGLFETNVIKRKKMRNFK